MESIKLITKDYPFTVSFEEFEGKLFLYVDGHRSLETVRAGASVVTVNKALARAIEWEFGVVAWERR